jgi:hypothetical protein
MHFPVTDLTQTMTPRLGETRRRSRLALGRGYRRDGRDVRQILLDYLEGNCQSVINPVLDVQKYLPRSVFTENYGNFEDQYEIDLYQPSSRRFLLVDAEVEIDNPTPSTERAPLPGACQLDCKKRASRGIRSHPFAMATGAELPHLHQGCRL